VSDGAGNSAAADDLSHVATADLLAGYAATLRELRRRDAIRSANAPAGDYAEWLVARATNGELVKNFSVKSFDITLPSGERVQVKARVTSDPPRSGQLQTSPFRSWDFELAAFVLLRDRDYAVQRAVLVPTEVVRQVAKHRPHVNGHVVFMTPALLDHASSRDITEAVRRSAREPVHDGE
jgi:hypothetical protein